MMTFTTLSGKTLIQTKLGNREWYYYLLSLRIVILGVFDTDPDFYEVSLPKDWKTSRTEIPLALELRFA